MGSARFPASPGNQRPDPPLTIADARLTGFSRLTSVSTPESATTSSRRDGRRAIDDIATRLALSMAAVSYLLLERYWVAGLSVGSVK